MHNLTKRDAERALKSLDAVKARYRNAIEKSQETVEHVVHGTISAASAFGFGVLQGRFASKGGLGIMGVPAELATAGAAYLAAALGVAGKMSDHLYAVGQGAADAFATTMGRGVGAKMARQVSAVQGEATLSSSELNSLSAPEV